MDRCEDWLCKMISGSSTLDEYGKSVLATMCWWIWKKRCNWIFRGERPDAKETVKLVHAQVEEFWKAKVKSCSKCISPREMVCKRLGRWFAPEEGMIKMNIDGSFREQDGRAGIGLVCRDKEGRFMGGLSKEVEALSPFMVECLALKEALLNCSRFSEHEGVVIEMDCEVLFKLILRNSSEGCEWQSWEILKEVLDLKESMEHVTFSLVSRQGNKAADMLAVGAAKKMYQNLWLVYVPSSLCMVLAHDSKRCRGSEGVENAGLSKQGIG